MIFGVTEHTLLIVEDEDIIRDGLVDSIPWSEYGFRVVGAAPDGVEAMQIFDREHPEAVLTDIKMPRKDGLQLLSCIRRSVPETEVVILSGYEDFEYAREGLKNGAFAYILKIELKKELPQVFRDLCRRLDDRVDQSERRIEFKRIELDHKLRQLEKGLDCDLLPEGSTVAAFACAIVDEADSANGTLAAKITYLIEEGFACHSIGSELVVALLLGTGDAEFHHKARRFAEACRADDNDALCSLGRAADDAVGAAESYRQARKALDFAIHRGMSGVVLFDEVARRLLVGQRLGNWREIGRMVLIAHGAEVEERIDDEIDRAIRSENIGLPELRLKVESMLALVSGSLPPEAFEIRERIASVAERLETWPLMSSLRQWLVETLLEIAEDIAALRASPIGDKIEKARGLIDRNFATDILLEDVAEYVFLSPSYFAARFKDTTGQTFSGYVRERRMKEASKLLSRSDLRLREIAEAVGYTDVKYFMRVFKQHTGLTANEFRKRERATSPDQQPRYQDSQDRPSPDHPFRDDPSQDVWSRNRD